MKRFTLIVALLFVTACGGSKAAEKNGAALTEDPAQTTGEPMESPETALGEALPNDGTRVVGDVTTCPVGGEVFEITAESPHAQHEEGTYYFCCRECLTKFVVDPEKFLAGGPVEHHGDHHAE